MAKNFTPLTSWQKLCPYLSFFRTRRIVRRPIFFAAVSTTLPSSVTSMLTSYRFCPPRPLGHQRSGFFISVSAPFTADISSPVREVIFILTSALPLVSAFTVTKTFPPLCRWVMRTSVRRAEFSRISDISRHIPASSSLAPQSQPNIQCALRKCINPFNASVEPISSSSAYFPATYLLGERKVISISFSPSFKSLLTSNSYVLCIFLVDATKFPLSLISAKVSNPSQRSKILRSSDFLSKSNFLEKT